MKYPEVIGAQGTGHDNGGYQPHDEAQEIREQKVDRIADNPTQGSHCLILAGHVVVIIMLVIPVTGITLGDVDVV